jgi:hypothetical protein
MIFVGHNGGMMAIEPKMDLTVAKPFAAVDPVVQSGSEASVSERRRQHRSRALKAAKLVAMNAWVFVDGVVKDQSAGGARIYCERPDVVPDEFRLLILKEQTLQPCVVRWRNGHHLGVAYCGEAKPAPPRKF